MGSIGKTPNIRAREELPRHEPGDVVAIRELWHGRVWYARPVIVVADEPSLRMFHVPPRGCSDSERSLGSLPGLPGGFLVSRSPQ